MAKILSFSLDRESLELLDKIENVTSFKNRSELIRSALQLLLNDSKELDKMSGYVNAIVVVTHPEYNEENISKITHQYSDLIATHIHNNVHSACMETFIVHGNAVTVSALVKSLKESKAVSYVKLMVVAD
ncbi:MAG: ribbon-helix-helix protein, CopG family [Candidatus Micrarchaeota archaeon]|nr:ribbon-helix-helix protein, CopG family [Candidatus Micrarchaeota archaeon]